MKWFNKALLILSAIGTVCMASTAQAADAKAVASFRSEFYQRCINDDVFKDIETLLAGINAKYDEKQACNCLADRTAKVPGIVDALQSTDENSKESRWATLKIYEMTFTCSTEVAKAAEKSLR